ncbi:tRNA (cmo5U34)-methyltransferase [Catalinimonas alkaloidigena]|uniref:methyltransferase domain-containing protein n=1 Tax=Catalinimonas alkaloidigena TaxID=1075417 RepID=UPI002406DA69|nr:class I SAM-dependent methyltransferase [Catalinimonas alkaloidigena]MDF9798312.1 tRNA (cmo5U34)-methyltransferase [Catalinimonas alkaloidigena]
MRSFSFQLIAPYYDLLARLVFGNTIDKAQKHFFSLIPKGSEVLIIGGGSGRILGDLIKVAQPNKITFLEASSNMLRIAKKKSARILKNNHRNTEMCFIHGTENDLPVYKEYDVLITFFLFDVYPTHEAKKLASKLSEHLKSSGVWLFSDFCLEGQGFSFLWKKVLLVAMYTFFRLVSNLHNQSLPDYQTIFKELHYLPVQQQYFYHNFIISLIYRKLLS